MRTDPRSWRRRRPGTWWGPRWYQLYRTELPCAFPVPGPLGLRVHARPLCVQSTQACSAGILRRRSEKLLAGQEGWGEPTLNPRTFRGHSAGHWALPGSFLNVGLPRTREGPARAHDAFARARWTSSGCRRADSARFPPAGARPALRSPPHPHSRLLLRLAPCPRSPTPPPSATPHPAPAGIRRRRHLSFMKESAPSVCRLPGSIREGTLGGL